MLIFEITVINKLVMTPYSTKFVNFLPYAMARRNYETVAYR